MRIYIANAIEFSYILTPFSQIQQAKKKYENFPLISNYKTEIKFKIENNDEPNVESKKF